jgi:hypothetical protein
VTEPSPDEVARRLEVAAWLEQVRWTWQEERARFDALGQQAVTVLGLDGVFLGLLATARPNIHHDWRGVLGFAVLAIVLSGASALWALWPRSLPGLPTRGMRERYNGYLSNALPSAFATKDFVGMIFSTTKNGRQEQVLERFSIEANKRGLRVRFSAIFLVAALVLVAVIVVFS